MNEPREDEVARRAIRCTSQDLGGFTWTPSEAAREAEAIVRALAATRDAIPENGYCMLCDSHQHAESCPYVRARVWVNTNPQPETAD